MGRQFGSALEMKQLVSAVNPASGANLLYFKGDGLLYKKDSAGVETAVASGGGSTTSVQTGPPSSPATGALWFDTDDPVSVPSDTGWNAVTFTNSWSNFGSAHQTAAYRKIGDVVYVRGLIVAGTANASCFTLPVGFRPTLIEMFGCVNNAGSVGRIDVAPDGTVLMVSSGTSFNSLTAIRFTVT